MILYHATKRVNLPSILSDGLLWGPGYDPVHLAKDGSWAVELTAMIRDLDVADIALLQVEVDGLRLVEPGWDGDGTFAYLGTVAPDRLTVVNDD